MKMVYCPMKGGLAIGSIKELNQTLLWKWLWMSGNEEKGYWHDTTFRKKEEEHMPVNGWDIQKA